MSKVLRYLFEFSDGAAVEVYEALGRRLLGNLRERVQTLKESETFDDALIDLNL